MQRRPAELEASWAALKRRMGLAMGASLAILALAAALVGILLLPDLWQAWIEWTWSLAVGGATLVLLVCQWRLASFLCPRCHGSWFERRMFLSNPFTLYRSRCANCDLPLGAAHWEPWTDPEEFLPEPGKTSPER